MYRFCEIAYLFVAGHAAANTGSTSDNLLPAVGGQVANSAGELLLTCMLTAMSALAPNDG